MILSHKKSFQFFKVEDNGWNIAEISMIVENGHDTFMRALSNRNKNLNSIRSMCFNGNLKTALDTAVNINDLSLMYDILKELNNAAYVLHLSFFERVYILIRV
jgi:hypothetical protein